MQKTFTVERVEKFITPCAVSYEVVAETAEEARDKFARGEYECVLNIVPNIEHEYDVDDAKEVGDVITVVDEYCDEKIFDLSQGEQQ